VIVGFGVIDLAATKARDRIDSVIKEMNLADFPVTKFTCLAQSESPIIRYAVAENSKTLTSILVRLTKDKDVFVAKVADRNPNLNYEARHEGRISSTQDIHCSEEDNIWTP